MPAAAAATLLDWQPVLMLEKENYSLREENRHLHFEVHELMAWKERALKQMVALGPKRQRATREVQQATQLQRKLQHVEKSLLERRALEETNEQLQKNHQQLQQRVEQLEEEAAMYQQQLAERMARESRARAHVQQIADHFRKHLEQLVAIRERIDEDQAEAVGTARKVPEEENRSASSNAESEEEEVMIEDPTVLVAGLSAVSDKCLRWFHEHVAQTFSKIQEKAALYEAQHIELEQLRTRVHAIRDDVDFSVAKEKQQSQQLVSIQTERASLAVEIQKLRTLQAHQSRGHTAMSDHVRLLVTEVRQYLRLVRAEIKKKFGYVPDAITHVDIWTRILDALDVLERQMRISQT